MDRQTKIDSIVSLMEDFPAAFNYLNLAGNRAFADWFMPRLEALREFDFWEDDELRVIQARRLGNLLSYLKKTSPFWKERLLAYGINPRSASILEDIKRLPVIDRKFFTGKEAYALPRDESHSMIHTRYTSGTTDTSMAVLISDPEMSLDILSCLFRQPYFDLQKMRELLGRKFFFFLGRTVLPHYASFARGFPLDNFTKLSDPNVRGEIYGILKKEPQTLWAFSTVAAEFAHYLAQDGESLPLLAAYTHSESSPIDERLFVREKLNVPVVHLYVACETAIIGDECTSHFGKGYYHIPRERALIEVLDGDNLPVKNNEEGKLVVTILDRKITPILRYANGDRGRILSVSCDCGKKSPLFEMLGREGDRILFGRHRSCIVPF